MLFRQNTRAPDRSQKKVKFLRMFRDKLAEKSADFVGIFGVNFADKQSIKYGCFCGNFLGKFH